MITIDYIFLALILISALLGFRKGFLGMLGSLIGLILSILIASRMYPMAADWFGGTNVANIVSFILIFIISTKIISIIFWVLGKLFEVVTILPFIESFDKLLGGILGLAQGIIGMAVIVYFLNKFPVNDWLTDQLSTSIVTSVLLTIGGFFGPLFPEAIKKLKSII
jgi:membrane protein required for colicin V production